MAVGASAVVVAAAVIVFVATRHRATAHETRPPVSVAVVKVQKEDLWREITFNAEFQPYQEVDLHAKVAGFVEAISVDIGDRVREGDTIAVLEIPELRADIEHAVASVKRNREDVRRAEAVYEEAHTNYERIVAVHKAQPNLIAQQDVDAAVSKDRTAASLLESAKLQVEVSDADVKKLNAMLAYSRITAPFSGVITKRYADKGALIQAGISSSTQTMPLVRLSENDRLRLVFPVSVSYVSAVHVGDPAEVRVPSVAGALHLKISRISGKVDMNTRSMDVEIDVPNADFRFIPGVYASVALKLDHKAGAIAIPVEALSPRQRESIYVVKDGIIEERTVKLGLETPGKVEATSGLSEGETVMIGSRAGVKPGQHVQARVVKPEGPL